MPLKEAKSRGTVGENIRTEVRAGKPLVQALRTALSKRSEGEAEERKVRRAKGISR